MKQANNYTIEDLVADVSFQQYCTGSNVDAVEYWKRYFDMQPEQRPLEREAKKLYFLLSGNHTAAQYSKHSELFKSKVANLEQAKKPGPNRKLLYQRIWFSAATIAIICGASFLLWQNYFSISEYQERRFVSKAGEKKTVTLEDGTVIILNGATTVLLDEGFNTRNRHLKLEGEGYFDVKHDEKVPFVVETKSLLITDLGTKFNVKAFSGDRQAEASLIEGLIEVAAIDEPRKKILLKPNQKIIFKRVADSKSEEGSVGQNTGKFSIAPLSKNAAGNTIVETDWVQNRLTFNEDDFSEIASKLERWYGIKIEFEKENIKAYRYVGTFEDQSITEVLDVLKISREFNYRKEGGRIIIY